MNLSSVMKQQAAGNRGNVFRKKKGPGTRQKSVQEFFLMPPHLLAIRAQIWTLFLFYSEQGNLTSCLELLNVFEIFKYPFS